MPGEIWRGSFQIGKESTYGTSVAATRKMYYRPDSRLAIEREQRQHRFQVGRRSNLLDATNGPQMPGGTLIQPLDSAEIVELLLITLKGGVTPITPAMATNTRLWTFTEGTTLDSATVEWDDGVTGRGWELAGAYGNTLRIAGSANGENLVTAELFGSALTQAAITGALSDRVPAFTEGWETKLYIDAFGATPGTTAIAAAQSIINWDVLINNQLGRKFTAANVNTMQAAVFGELAITGTLTFEAAGAQALTEFTAWGAETKRLIRLEFGQNDTIETTFKKFVTVDLPCAWSAVDLGGTDEGTRVYAANFTAVYDPTNAFMVQVRAQANRTTAY